MPLDPLAGPQSTIALTPGPLPHARSLMAQKLSLWISRLVNGGYQIVKLCCILVIEAWGTPSHRKPP